MISRSRGSLRYLLVVLAAVAIFLVVQYRLQRLQRGGASADTSIATTLAATQSSAEIKVFFSHAYGNDPSVPREDRDNIDRHIEEFINRATRSLDAAIFELESERIATALVAASKRGVAVRIVSDAEYRENPAMLEVMRSGIGVRFDERSALMHNKFLIADAERVWTGSYNATDNCSYRNNNNGISISSKALADNYQLEFNEMFDKGEFGPRSPSRVPHNPVVVGDATIYTYFSPEDDIPPKLVRIIRTARKSIHFMAFSFSDDDIARAMIQAVATGVGVEGVVETTGSMGRGAVAPEFDHAGIPVLRDGNKYLMHHKVIIVDSLWTITGSYNFSASAARSNDENVLIIRSREVARRFEEEYGRIKAMAAAVR